MENPSLLRFLVDMRGEESTSVQLRDDLMTMLIAGHETTAAVLTWAMFEMSQQPESWTARLKEIDQLLDDLARTKSDDDARAVYQRGMQRLLAPWIGTPPSVPEETTRLQAPVRKKKRPDTEEILPDEK